MDHEEFLDALEYKLRRNLGVSASMLSVLAPVHGRLRAVEVTLYSKFGLRALERVFDIPAKQAQDWRRLNEYEPPPGALVEVRQEDTDHTFIGSLNRGYWSRGIQNPSIPIPKRPSCSDEWRYLTDVATVEKLLIPPPA